LSAAAVLQADGTTQSALSLSCATSLAVTGVKLGRLLWQGERERGFAKPRDIPGDEAVGRKVDPPVVGQRRPLHRGFTGVAAAVDVAGRGAELHGHCL
jgi:hypothetical protein